MLFSKIFAPLLMSTKKRKQTPDLSVERHLHPERLETAANKDSNA